MGWGHKKFHSRRLCKGISAVVWVQQKVCCDGRQLIGRKPKNTKGINYKIVIFYEWCPVVCRPTPYMYKRVVSHMKRFQLWALSIGQTLPRTGFFRKILWRRKFAFLSRISQYSFGRWMESYMSLGTLPTWIENKEYTHKALLPFNNLPFQKFFKSERPRSM